MRLISIFTLLGILFFTRVVHGQNESAVYLISDHEGRNCSNTKTLLNVGGKYCLEKSPFIRVSDFSSVSDIYTPVGGTFRQFDITFKPSGSRKLNTLAALDQNARIGVVIKGELVSVIVVHSPFNSRLISLYDEAESRDFDRIQVALKSEITSR